MINQHRQHRTAGIIEGYLRHVVRMGDVQSLVMRMELPSAKNGSDSYQPTPLITQTSVMVLHPPAHHTQWAASQKGGWHWCHQSQKSLSWPSWDPG